MRRLPIALIGAVLLAACAPTATLPAGSSAAPSPTLSASPTPFSAPSDAPPPSPLPSGAALGEPAATPETTPLPGTTPFPTPGPTITPGSTRVIGTILHADGSPAAGVCVILEKGICPVATDANGVWFTDIPAGPINWNFIYKVDGQEAGRQFLLGSGGGELRLPAFTLTG
jgi:hypothetical protein